MAKLDRLGWAAGIAFTSHGLRMGVRVNCSDALDDITSILPIGWKPLRSPIVDMMCSVIVGGNSGDGRSRRYHVVYMDSALVARSLSWDFAFDAIEKSLRFYVAEFSPLRIFVHAGVVGWGGKAIVIPGSTFTGKSTLVAELVGSGATYYSDELAVFDKFGRVHPYPSPIQLRDSSNATERRVRAEDMGGQTGKAPLRVGLVLETRFRPGAVWRPRPMTAGGGMLCLLKNTICARRQPERSIAALSRAVSDATFFKGARGEARDVVHAITNLPVFGKVTNSASAGLNVVSEAAFS